MSDFEAKMQQIRLRLGFCPIPRWGSYSVPPAPLPQLDLRGSTSKFREDSGRERREGSDGRGREQISEILNKPLFATGGRAGGFCAWVCVSVTMITGNCVHRSSPYWVCAGVNICGSSLLQPARSVCVSLSPFFILILFLAQTASLTTMMLTGRNFCDPASYCHTLCLRRTPLLMCDPFVVANLRVE